MEAFNLKKKCCKCGGDNLVHRWKQKGERLDLDTLALAYAKYELIRTYCRTCGYRWSSLPLDDASVSDFRRAYNSDSPYALADALLKGW